jgi:hypothetical protein
MLKVRLISLISLAFVKRVERESTYNEEKKKEMGLLDIRDRHQ